MPKAQKRVRDTFIDSLKNSAEQAKRAATLFVALHCGDQLFGGTPIPDFNLDEETYFWQVPILIYGPRKEPQVVVILKVSAITFDVGYRTKLKERIDRKVKKIFKDT